MFSRIRVIALLLIAVAAGFFFYTLATTGRPTDLVISDAAKSMRAGDLEAARKFADEALADKPDYMPALMIAGEASARSEQFEAALEYYNRLDTSDLDLAFNGILAKADILRHIGRTRESIAEFKTLADHAPLNKKTNRRLAQMFNMTGHRWEADRPMFGQLQGGDMNITELMYLGKFAPVLASHQQIQEMHAQSTADPVALVGLAETSIAKEEFDQAEDLLREALKAEPIWLPAAFKLGTRLVDREDETEFLSLWQRIVDSGKNGETEFLAVDNPYYWMIHGKWEASHERPESAIRCFFESVKRDPNNPEACHQLGRLLTQANKTQAGEQFSKRAERLRELEKLLRKIRNNTADLKSLDEADRARGIKLLEQAANLLLDLNRKPEAWAWARIAESITPGTPWSKELSAGLSAGDLPRMSRTDTGFMGSSADLINEFPLPKPIDSSSADSTDARPTETGEETSVRFKDVTDQANLQFTYFNNADSSSEGARMFEFTGGGIGVLDIDADGWPDLALTQGSRLGDTTSKESLPKPIDRFFRNVHGQFTDITQLCGISEADYSQGVAIGDVNSDGFDDVYVANFGSVNRLFTNLGDGTFAEAKLPETNIEWTTSCVIVDVNGDGNPDIYDANYVSADDVATRICNFGGHKGVCGPTGFAPAPDRLLLNLGNGKFSDATEASGISNSSGRNMGVVALDLFGNQKISLLVANDEGANLLYTNTAAAGQPPKFEESGIAAGLAYNGAGKAQGGMGIIADDVNRDGRPDIFVTNYYAESNTLYQQLDAGFFDDATRGARLQDASVNLLGFGTQFIDADLDGSPDLLVANGHLDDFSFRSMPYQMRPQFFQNTGDGTFVEPPGATVGSYFDKKLLGRPLAKFDYNNDGKTDFAVTHLQTPAALLQNATEKSGKSLTFRMVGTTSNRDAIGTQVSVSGPHDRYQQLSAGDGYQSSNERTLVFGLGEGAAELTASIVWPDGTKQSLSGLPNSGEITCIQGRAGFLVTTTE